MSPQPHYAQEHELSPRLRLMRWLGRQSWIKKGNNRLMCMLHNPDNADDHYLFDVDFYGKRYRGDLANFNDWLVFCYGGAPPTELRVLAALTAEIRRTRSGPVVFFDVGANIGHHTLFMSGVADRVIAFEPFPSVRSLMEEKIALNALENVQVVPVALGVADEDLTYFPGLGTNSGIGTFLPSNAPQQQVSHTLPVRHGDKLFAERGFPAIDILKVDVEGFEAYVFRGLKERIERDRPAILTELTPASRSVFGSEQAWRECFYDGAVFAAVSGRPNVPGFILSPFDYQTSEEILILPPEMAEFIASRITS